MILADGKIADQRSRKSREREKPEARGSLGFLDITGAVSGTPILSEK